MKRDNQRQSTWRCALIAGVVLALTGCASVAYHNIPITHILQADAAGEPIDLTKEGADAVMDNKAYGVYLSKLFADLEQHCSSQKPAPCRVLIFAHGGLNKKSDTTRRAIVLTPEITAAGYFPIFVNWRSGFVTSWKDHVLDIHGGIKDKKLGVFAPIQVAMDEASAVARTPEIWFSDIRHATPMIEHASDQWKSALHSYIHIADGTTPGVMVNVDVLDSSRNGLADGRSVSERWLPRLSFIPTLPTKALGAPLAVHALGSGAWDVMERRTVNLFMTEDDFEPNVTGKILKPQSPTAKSPLLKYFLDRLENDEIPKLCAKSLGQLKGCAGLEITLVGHSMGTMVINRWLRYKPNVEIRNIVLMAGAASVGDYRDSVVAYLSRQRERLKEFPNAGIHLADVYHLVLHPTAEVTEEGPLDLSPRGSLLVWIDNFYTRPLTPLDRTVGRFFNLMPELYRMPTDEDGKRLASQIHVRVFRVGKHNFEQTDPQRHGDFGSFPFWNPAFWCPLTPEKLKPRRCEINELTLSARCDTPKQDPPYVCLPAT